MPAHGDRWHEIWDEEYARDGHVEKVNHKLNPDLNPKLNTRSWIGSIDMFKNDVGNNFMK